MKLKLILSTTLLTSALLATTAPQARTLIQNKDSDTLVTSSGFIYGEFKISLKSS